MSNQNKKLRTLTLPSLEGNVTYDLYPDWDNIENKPEVIIVTSMSYGETLPETGVEGQLFFLIGGGIKATESDGIITISN